MLRDEYDDAFPDEYILLIDSTQLCIYFHRASNKRGNRAGVLLLDPQEIHFFFFFLL